MNMLTKVLILISLLSSSLGIELVAFEYTRSTGLLGNVEKIIFYLLIALTGLSVCALISCFSSGLKEVYSATQERLLAFALEFICASIPMLIISIIGCKIIYG